MLAFEEDKSPAIIKVVGVGGAGMNAIERMVALNLGGVEIIAMNTDEQVLRRSAAHLKVHLGGKLTRGMGAGAKPEIGAQAAMEDRDKIQNVLKGADMVFITAGMGGGTGTGAAPIVAEVARELGALTVGVVTMPFKAEGTRKLETARQGQSNLREKTDTLITIPNDSIFKVIDRNTSISLAFKALDDVLARAVIGISEIINSTGYVNVDFADVRTVMGNNGDAVIGMGDGEGENRVHDALQNAIHHPLLEGRSVDGAQAVLINVAANAGFSMYEYNEIMTNIHEVISKDANVIVGFTEVPDKDDSVTVTVVATGFRRNPVRSTNDRETASNEPVVAGRNETSSTPHIIPLNRGGAAPKTEPSAPWSRNQFSQGSSNMSQSFPNLDTSLEDLNIPAYLRKQK